MPNQELPNPKRLISGPNVEVEISPATRSNPPDMLDFVKALVEQHFAELVNRREDFTFRPFVETQQVSREIRRLQTPNEILAWGRVFEEHGCLHCHRRNLVHVGCGFCGDCYRKVKNWKKSAIRRNSKTEPEIEFKIAALDREKLARLALTGIVEHELVPSSTDEIVASAPAEIPALLDAPTEINAKAIEPERHASWCKICQHPHREEIEREYIEGRAKYGTVRAIVRKYQLRGSAGLYKHARAVGLNAKRASYL